MYGLDDTSRIFWFKMKETFWVLVSGNGKGCSIKLFVSTQEAYGDISMDDYVSSLEDLDDILK